VAAARADQLLEDGNTLAAASWHRILDAIERLQAKAQAGEKMQEREPRSKQRVFIA
jgi:hypothetical protein